jgi:hypothetical protein
MVAVHTLHVTPLDETQIHERSLQRVIETLRGRAQIKAIGTGLEVTIRGNPSLGYAHVRAALSFAVGAEWADYYEIRHISDRESYD